MVIDPKQTSILLEETNIKLLQMGASLKEMLAFYTIGMCMIIAAEDLEDKDVNDFLLEVKKTIRKMQKDVVEIKKQLSKLTPEE